MPSVDLVFFLTPPKSISEIHVQFGHLGLAGFVTVTVIVWPYKYN